VNAHRIRGRVSNQDVNKSAQLTWNAFVDLLSSTPYELLDPEQQVAYLVFWYDTEVKNGGHLQYFKLRGTAQLDDTLRALKQINAAAQFDILTKAAQAQNEEHNDKTDLDALDMKFHACQPELPLLLESYLVQHLDAFIECEE
jgi:hypothetical protein